MAPRPVAVYGAIFAPDDVDTIVKVVDLPLAPDVDVASIANQLDGAAMDLVLSTRAMAGATPGECAQWLREVEIRARAFLACFTDSDDYSRLPREAAIRLLGGPDRFLDLDARAPMPGSMVPKLLASIHAMELRAGLAASQYEARKSGKRRPPDLELGFYQTLKRISRDAFGLDWAVSTDASGARIGPGVRFCKAVGEHISKNVPDVDVVRDEALATALQRLQTASGSAERIRDVRSGGPVRKR